MRRRIVDLRGGEVPLLDVVSYGRAHVVTPRQGDLELETDMGMRLGGPGSARDLAADWDLDLEALSRQSERSIRGTRRAKLVHNLIFSMPAGTSPEKVLKAVRRLAKNEWQLKHRYAMAL
jgi:hypothetical protein